MKVLVAVASKHGSTREIAQAIARELRALDVVADLHDMRDEVIDVDQYDGVVLGSAVYAGNWLLEAKRFSQAHREKLLNRPTWLFSSGPLAEGVPQPQTDPAKLITGIEGVPVLDHRIFVGKLDPIALGLGERLMAKVVGAPAGDFRDWDDIRAWAHEVASQLHARSTTGAGR